jgi:hypothetical protein
MSRRDLYITLVVALIGFGVSAAQGFTVNRVAVGFWVAAAIVGGYGLVTHYRSTNPAAGSTSEPRQPLGLEYRTPLALSVELVEHDHSWHALRITNRETRVLRDATVVVTNILLWDVGRQTYVESRFTHSEPFRDFDIGTVTLVPDRPATVQIVYCTGDGTFRVERANSERGARTIGISTGTWRIFVRITADHRQFEGTVCIHWKGPYSGAPTPTDCPGV